MSIQSLQALKGRVIRSILFDFGDTLWCRRDMEVWHRQETASDQRAAMTLRPCVAAGLLAGLDDALLGRRIRDAFDKQTRAMIRRDPDIEPDCALAIVEAVAELGFGRIDYATGAAIFEALRVRIPESRPLFDDALLTLAELRRRGFLLGVVTNRLWGGATFQEDLQTLGLLNYFDPAYMAISADLGVRKPNPAIFLHSLNALRVAPEEAVMVGDSLRSDIVGAKALGIFSIWKPKPRIRAELQARLVAPGAASGSRQDQVPAFEEERPADLPPGMHITDDDYVLAYAQDRDNKYKMDTSVNDEIRPDLTIENLSDLLDIFLKVGG